MKRAVLLLPFFLLGTACVAQIYVSKNQITLKLVPQKQEKVVQEIQKPSPTPDIEKKENYIFEATTSAVTIQRNPTLTPGDVIQNLPLDLLCMEGYTTTVRNVSKTTKKNVFELYNISYPPKENTYVIDHLIPLELGGSNSIKNLWPQSIEESSTSAKMKDKLENMLHTKVCEGSISLYEAQSIFSHDWLAWYEDHVEKQ